MADGSAEKLRMISRNADRRPDRQAGQTTVRQHRANRFTDGRPKKFATE